MPTRACLGRRRFIWPIAFAILAFASAVLMGVSTFGFLWIARGSAALGINRGIVVLSWGHQNPALQILSPGVYYRHLHPGLQFGFPSGAGLPGVTVVGFPLWIPLLAGAAVSVYSFRKAGSIPPDQCPQCEYSRQGLSADSPCPECGHRSSPG